MRDHITQLPPKTTVLGEEEARRHRENTVELIVGTIVILGGILIGLFVLLSGGQG